MHMDISATFRLDPAEVRSAARNVPAVRSVLLICAALAVGAVAATAAGDPQWLMLAVGVGLPAFVEGAIRWSARKSAPLLAQPWTVRLTDSGFALTTAVSQATVAWGAYSAGWSRSKFWYLRQASGTVSFIPRRALDAAQQAEFAAFQARALPPPRFAWYDPRTWR